MNLRNRLLICAAIVSVLAGSFAVAAPSYRSFLEWNGPYYHVRHALNADSSAYMNYMVNNPLPLYSSPFSSPTAVEMYGSVVSPTVFVVDHDHRRVQVFGANAGWRVEALGYSSTPVQGNYGGRSVKFSLGQTLPNSERITVNGRAFTRVSALTGYGAVDSVYSIVYNGVPNTGGVATLPTGWNLGPFDSVRVEYGYATPPGTASVGDIDYLLYQTTPTDIPLQLNEATSASDPGMNDITALAINGSARPGNAIDLYLVNGLPGGAGTLASYDLTTLGATGTFNFVDSYPGLLGRPYDVEIVDNGANVAGTVAAGVPSGVVNGRLSLSITNQNTFLGNDYRITYSFDTSSTMNQSATPNNLESDLAYDPIAGRLHIVFCRDGAGTGTAYSYSDDYGRTWAAAQTISSASLTGAIDRPRMAIRSTGEIHVVYEAEDGSGDRHLYHTYSTDGISWASNLTLTSVLTPATVAENRYVNLLVDRVTDNIHLIWAGDDDVYHRVYSTAWGGTVLAASGGGGANFSAPHAVMDNVGRVYMAYVSNAAPPWTISYMLFNGAVWGSYAGGGFTSGTPDVVTAAAGFLSDGGSRGEPYPFPQVAITGDSIWIFWVGTGAETYGTDQAQLRYNRVNTLAGDFTAGAGTAITTADDCAPMLFSVAVDKYNNLHIAYPYSAVINREGLRYKKWTAAANSWFPAATTYGRHLFNEGLAGTQFAFEPRLIAPAIAGQIAPMLACGKAYTLPADFGTRILFKVIDGVVTITDQTQLSQFNQWCVLTHAAANVQAIPGLSFTISNSTINISNTEDVNATEFNLGDYFEIDGTAPAKNDRLFLTDSDNHRVKVIRAYDNIDNCFGGAERYDVPGRSNGTPGQTYKLATVGGEGTFRIWASPDSTVWTVVSNLLIAGPTDRYCEINRFTREIRFGDGVHGMIPPAGTYIRVRYEESVDEAEFGSLGSAAGQMSFPRGLAVNYNTAQGGYDIYTCDTGNNRLQKWSYSPNTSVDPVNWTSYKTSWTYAAADTDYVSNPADVEAVMLNNRVYLVVTDNGNARVIVYRDDEASGNGGNAPPVWVATVGGRGTSLNQFIDPRGLAVMAEDSGLVIFAADADRDQVAKILRRDWLTTAADDTSSEGQAGTSTLTISLTDALDGDNYLLLQPGAVRTIELRVARTDSLVALRAVANFPAGMIDILSVNEGNLWSGERYTNKVFLFNYDNATGRFEVNASMVGDNDGLSSPGSRVAATLVVRADSNMTIPAAGQITFADSTELRKAGNRRISTFVRDNLNLRGGYLADIATQGGNPGTAPRMVPQPDGAISFADVNVFTQGWNGNGINFDPIADLGPWLGNNVPLLAANPDGRLDARDMLALNTMYNWYNSGGSLTMPPPPAQRDGRGLDSEGPIVAAARRTAQGWTIELQVRNIEALTTAHLYVDAAAPEALISGVRAGDFLGTENTLFLHTVQGTMLDICLGRLNREQPSVSGSGVLATFELSGVDVVPQLLLRYELRNNRNAVLDAGDITRVNVQGIPAQFGLNDPYPNPFNAVTTFTLNLSDAARVNLRVFNVLGQEVANVVDRHLPAGVHNVLWDARDARGTALPSGLYFAQFDAAGKTDMRKVILLR